MRPFFVPSVSALLIALAPSVSLSKTNDCNDLPNFTDIARVIEAAPVTNGTVLAWDYMAADANGIQTAPGRVGDKAFDKSVLDAVGAIIQQNPRFASGSPQQLHDAMTDWQGNDCHENVRVLEIEYDSHGGAGRAGYLKIPRADGGYSWVNIKGIGVTGLGNTGKKKPSPPRSKSQSHSDGGAVDAEGFREFVYGLMAQNELKYGGSRIIGVIATNMQKNIGNGEKESLAIIVREPMRRMDRSRERSL